MRENLLYLCGGAGILLLLWNLYTMFIGLPDDLNQGPIYRIMFFHVPAAFVFMASAFAALVGSVMFLSRKNFRYDAFAASVTEVGLVFGAINLVTGMIWARIIWGIWWAWDARLTFMLISWLMYGGYLMLRQAIDEPTQRARYAAVLSILTFPGVIINWKAIDWWRTQHPGPVLTIRGNSEGLPSTWEAVLWWNVLAIMLIAVVMLFVRMHQEGLRRELDALRREAHAGAI
jgi:heme exporter protein C